MRARLAGGRSCSIPVLALLCGCHGWLPAGSPVSELRVQAAKELEDRDSLRLVTDSGRVIRGTLAELTPDSVEIRGTYAAPVLSLEEVSRLDVWKLDGGRTLFLGLGVATVAFGAFLIGLATWP